MTRKALVVVPLLLLGAAQAALVQHTFDISEGTWAPDGKRHPSLFLCHRTKLSYLFL